LYELRQAKGLTQEQLAEAAAVSVGAVRHWEQGTRRLLFGHAYRIAKALSISLDELAGRVFEGRGRPAPPRPRGRPRKHPAAAQAGEKKLAAKGKE
jgi:transcriptional regulator with XRE-family HTH domain